MELVITVGLTVLMNFGWQIAIYFGVRNLTRSYSHRRFKWLLYFLLALFGGATGLIIYLPFTQELPLLNFSLLIFMLDLVTTLVGILVHSYIFPHVSKRIIFFICVLVSLIASFLQVVTTTLLLVVLRSFIETDLGYYLYIFLEGVLTALIVIAFFQWFARRKAFQVFQKVLQFPNFTFIISLVIYFLLQIIIHSVLQMVTDRSFPTLMVWGISYLVVLAFGIFLFWQYFREQRLKSSELLVQQQQNYVNRLEIVQQELRKVQHDYKNVATGLYAHMEAGDLAAAQEYISQKLLKIDEGLQLSIQQANQLTNIKVIELKTLLMAKILEGEKQGVTLAIEVVEPVTQIPLEITDLLRAVGILIDNAMEAAATTLHAQVQVVFIQEAELIILIKNPLQDSTVDLQKIWQAGFSSKGEQRGLGLANLKEILQRYPNAMIETRLRDGQFIQILTIGRKSKV